MKAIAYKDAGPISADNALVEIEMDRPEPGQDEEIRLFHEQLKQTMRLLLPEVSSSKRIKIL